MKLIRTNFDMKAQSSFVVFIGTEEAARAIYDKFSPLKDIMGPDWYYNVMRFQVDTSCIVPKIFHNRGYWATVINHNNGDWDKEANYTLYMIEE